MVKAVSKTGARRDPQPATHYPGNNLSEQLGSSPELTDGRLFCPLEPMAAYYGATATVHHRDSNPGASHSKAEWFDLPTGEPKQLVRTHALASSRPGSPFYLSYRLAATDHPVRRPGSQARCRGGTPGFSTDSPGVTGCQGVGHAHWGRKPDAPVLGYALRWSSYN